MPDATLAATETAAPASTAQSSFNSDLKRIRDLAKKDGVASQTYRTAFATFMAGLYAFGKTHIDDIDLINFQLNERQLLTARGKPTPFWSKVVKLAAAEKTPQGTWIYDRDKVSMYGRVLAEADQNGLAEADAPSYFASGFKVRLQQARERTSRTVTPSPSEDLLNSLKQDIARLLPNAAPLIVDIAAAGLKPGKHKLLADIRADGTIELIAILPASEQSIRKELSKAAQSVKTQS